MKQYRKILTFAHSGIGDAVMLVPLLAALRKGLPDSAIACTAHSLTADILAMTDLRLGIVPWPKNWRRKPLELLRGLAAIRAFRPDLLIAPPAMNLRLASWTARASGCAERLAILVGHGGIDVELSSFHSKSFTRIFPKNENGHKVEQCQGLLNFLGETESLKTAVLQTDPDISSMVRELLIAEVQLDIASERFVCAHLGCEPANRTKLWPVERMVRALEAICRKLMMRCLILWGPDDLDLVQKALSSSQQNSLLIPFPWRASLPETASILAKAELLVSNDCGVAHVAAGVGTRVVTIFGPTDPRFLGPYGPRSAVVYRKPTCGPCYPERRFHQCPYRRVCLSGISVDVVVKVIQRILNNDYPSVEEQIDDGVFWAPSLITAFPASSSAEMCHVQR